ncbi:MAG: preprotein translocase subunit YajC [Clostridia bacterium]|nr:preprotein translocase subunit YajC [Clostridia bacterium]
MGNYTTFITLGLFILIFYFMLIRPENKRKKQAQEMRSSIKVGDTIITIGGITGEVEKIREKTVTIFTGDGSIDIQKWAIRSVEPGEEEAEADNFTYTDEELEDDAESHLNK